MLLKKFIGCALILFNYHAIVRAQEPNAGRLSEPEVGKVFPLRNFATAEFYSKKQLSLDDFKGKWIILDFWDKFCTGCIARFPSVNQEQKKFRDKVQILTVSWVKGNDNDNRIMYAKYHRNLPLEMPGVFVDKTVWDSWNILGLPHDILIDPNGIIRAITQTVTSDQLQDIIEGKNPIFEIAAFKDGKELLSRYTYDRFTPFLLNNNGGPDTSFAFRSILTTWRPGMPQSNAYEKIGDTLRNGGSEILKGTHLIPNKGRFERLFIGLKDLYVTAYFGTAPNVIRRYRSAYYGEFWPSPLLEVSDTLAFAPDFATGRNTYCYSLSVPPERANPLFMMQVMQNDLKNYFGYTANIEDREMPVYKLVVKDSLNKGLKASGEVKRFVPYGFEHEFAGGKYVNQPISLLMIHLLEAIKHDAEDPPLIVDETNINWNINLDAEWTMSDNESIRKALQKNGLDLVKGTKKMKVIVIRDALNSNKK